MTNFLCDLEFGNHHQAQTLLPRKLQAGNFIHSPPIGVEGFHDSTKGTYLLREFPLANKVPSRDFLTKNYDLHIGLR